MATLTVNNKSYDIDTLSDDARAQMQSLQYVDAELQRLNATIAVFQTARMAYLNALQPLLESAKAQDVEPPRH